ncbi:MAG: uracil phosphoribosyltransferase [Cyclobacteriaceae bacterium]
MKINVLNSAPSIINHFLAEIRDTEVQKDRLRFRKNMERIGEIMAYEISKVLDYRAVTHDSPLAQFKTVELVDPPYLMCILRASLPYYQGFLNYFDQADSGFVGAYRKPTEGSEFDISLDYLVADDITGNEVIIADPMLATGKSLIHTIQLLKDNGQPKHIHLASVIAAQPGVDHLAELLGDEFTLWTAALDPELNEHHYIVPGLGDAGDLAFGNKL